MARPEPEPTKQCYDLEDIRVIAYGCPRDTVAPVMAAAFFTAVVLGTTVKPHNLAIRLLQAAMRLFRVPDLRILCPGQRHCRGLRQVTAAVTSQPD